jgi:hypothetical protein
MAKTKRRSRPEPSTSYYILQITDWDWSYHFGVNAARHDDRRYSDYRHLLVRGKVFRPSALRQKAEPVEVTFFPDVSQAALEERGGERPLSVGYLQIHENVLTGGISMATDALGLVMQMLIAGRFNYLVLYGEPMRYRRARIGSYHFETQLNPEDYPDE